MYRKLVDTYINTRVLTGCYCAGCFKEVVMEDMKCVHKIR